MRLEEIITGETPRTIHRNLVHLLSWLREEASEITSSVPSCLLHSHKHLRLMSTFRVSFAEEGQVGCREEKVTKGLWKAQTLTQSRINKLVLKASVLLGWPMHTQVCAQ